MTTASRTGVWRSMEITLPRLFEIMTVHDDVRIREWYVTPGEVIEPGVTMLKVRAPGRTITIPTPPEVVVPHRVVRIAEAEVLHLGDFLILLEPVKEDDSPHGTQERVSE